MPSFLLKFGAIFSVILISISVGLSVGLNNSIKGNPNSTQSDLDNLYYSISFSLASIVLSALVFGKMLSDSSDDAAGVLKTVVLLVPTILVGVTLGIAFGYQTYYLNDNRFKAAIALLGLVVLITLGSAWRYSNTTDTKTVLWVIILVSILMIISGSLLWAVEDPNLQVPESVKNGYKSLYFITVFGGIVCGIISAVLLYRKNQADKQLLQAVEIQQQLQQQQ